MINLKRLSGLLLILGGLFTLGISTDSSLLDLEVSVDNYFSASPGPLPKIVINEIYYWPDETHSQSGNAEGKFEWLELYNLEDFEVSLKDWQIIRPLALPPQTIIIHPNVKIPPRGFLLISRDASIWPRFWGLFPSQINLLTLGANVKSDLSNFGETLVLKDKEGDQIDRVDYRGGHQGYSFARQPNGTDTFIDLFPPTPGH